MHFRQQKIAAWVRLIGKVFLDVKAQQMFVFIGTAYQGVFHHLGIAGQELFGRQGLQKLAMDAGGKGRIETAYFVFQSVVVKTCLAAC